MSFTTHPKHEANVERSAAIDRANADLANLQALGLTYGEARVIVKYRQLLRDGNGLRMLQVVADGPAVTFWRLRPDGGIIKE